MSRITVSYEIGRFTGVCAATGEALPPDTPCIATLSESPDHGGFERRDYSIAAWETGARPEGLFSFWRTVVPRPDAPRRLLVDDDTLLEIVTRLEEDERPERQAFRFVLALVLLRRRRLRSVGRERLPGAGADGSPREVWLLAPRGAPEGSPPLRILDPRLGEADLRSIAEQLGEVLESEGS